MRKLVILKSLVDFIWFVTCIPLIGLLLFFSVYMFIDLDVLPLIFNVKANESLVLLQAFSVLFIAICFIGIYCFYLFRKTLSYFQQVRPFDKVVIQNFYKIGYLLTIIGCFGSVLFFVSKVVIKNKFEINLGVSPYLILICLGLFFMVLSEVFKIAKRAKEENNLTV
ncbi:MAG: DUF2975 domain-containing protein [Winogradskyella sp.]